MAAGQHMPASDTGPGGAPEGYAVELADLTALRGLGDGWAALSERAAEPNVFYHPGFALPAIEALGFADDIEAVLVWRETPGAGGRTLVGLFPFVRRWRWGVPISVGEALIHPYATSSAPLVSTDDAPETIRAFRTWLDTDPQAPAAWIFRVHPADGLQYDAVWDAAVNAGEAFELFGDHERAVLNTAGLDTAYLQEALRRKSRREYARLRRRLAEGGDVTFTCDEAPEDVARAMGEFLVLEAAGWKGKQGTAAASVPATEWMLQEIAERLGADGRCRIHALRLDGKPVAVTVSCGQGETWWLWKIAYDEAFAQYSPGVLLILDITEAALKADSPVRYDSCAQPNHPMIDRIWRQRRAYADILLVSGRLSPKRQRTATRLETLRRQAEWAAREVLRLAGKG